MWSVNTEFLRSRWLGSSKRHSMINTERPAIPIFPDKHPILGWTRAKQFLNIWPVIDSTTHGFSLLSFSSSVWQQNTYFLKLPNHFAWIWLLYANVFIIKIFMDSRFSIFLLKWLHPSSENTIVFIKIFFE